MQRTLALAALAAGIGAGAAHAQGVAVGASIGTTGGVAEAQVELAPMVQLRGGYNYFQYEADDTYDGVAYTGDLDLTTLGAFVDFRPFGGSFLLTAGAYFGDKGLDLNATPTQNVEIGTQTFTPAQVGTLTMGAQLEETAPFVGLGWDSTFQGDGNWGFKFIAGAMFTGSPQVNLTSSGGTLSNDPNFQTQLNNEEQNLQDEVDDYEIYPVLQAGVTFAF